MSWGPRNTPNFPLPHPLLLAKVLPPFCGGLWLQNAESAALSWGSERSGPSAWWEGPGRRDGMQRCLLKSEELTCCSPKWHLVRTTPETGFLRGRAGAQGGGRRHGCCSRPRLWAFPSLASYTGGGTVT